MRHLRIPTKKSEPFTADSFTSARHFARYMLRDDRLLLAPMRDAIWTAQGHKEGAGQNVMTCILFRSGCWQVELLVVHPNSLSPMHRHNHCESADVLLNGDISGTVGGIDMKRPRGSNLAANIACLPMGAWHGGGTEKGMVCLSFQRWIGMEPTFIANDWESYHGE